MTQKYFEQNLLFGYDTDDNRKALLFDKELTFQYIAALVVTGRLNLFHDEYALNALRNYVETGSLKSLVDLLSSNLKEFNSKTELSCFTYKGKEFIEYKEV